MSGLHRGVKRKPLLKGDRSAGDRRKAVDTVTIAYENSRWGELSRGKTVLRCGRSIEMGGWFGVGVGRSGWRRVAVWT